MDNLTEAKKMLASKAYKSVEKSINKTKNKSKQKILKINSNESIIEGNLIEMPFISYNNSREIINAVEYTWIDSNKVKRGVEVRGSKYGVPTSYEFDVLLALLRIYIKNSHIVYGDNIITDIDLIDSEDVEINFSIRELLKEMGNNSANPKMYEKVLKSLQILLDTTIYNRFDGGIYDITNKDYISSQMEAFHIIEHLSVYDSNIHGDVSPNEIRNFTSVRLNKFFYKSIANSYFKYYDYEIYKKISNGVARKIFLLLTKWDNGSGTLKIGFNTLYQRIPLDYAIPNYRKNQTIKRANDDLVKVGYIDSYEIVDSNIVYKYKGKDNTPSIQGYSKKFKTLTDVVQGLHDYDFSEMEIESILEEYLADLKYLKALLRYVYVLQAYGKISDSPKNYIVKGLKSKYSLDSKYFD